MEQPSSTNKMSSQPLGDLSKLPPEVRNMIYEELLPFLRPEKTLIVLSNMTYESVTKMVGNGRLGVLRTCRQLNREITPCLYHEQTIRFCVDSGSRDWLRISDERGASWLAIYPRIDLFDSFSNLPYEKLSGIKIDLVAPVDGFSSEDNEKELRQLWENVHDVVHMLKATRSLPPLQIQLRPRIHPRTDERSLWTLEDDSPKRTLFGKSYEKNYMIALLPFFALQNITKVDIKSANLEKEAPILENVQQTLEQKIPLSQILRNKEYWNGNNIRNWMMPKWKAKRNSY